MKQLANALKYLDKGFSVIPVKANKKPYISWEEFQKRRPTREEVTQWWTNWPFAMIGIVTGSISGIDVVDTDNQEADEELQSYLPDSFICPTQRTPGGGKHYVFTHADGIRNSNDRSPFKFHVRGQGGFFIAAPSQNGAGRYQWLDGLNIDEVAPPPMPAALYNSLSLYALGGDNEEHTKAHEGTPKHKMFREGRRDEDLFHTANCLIKGGMGREETSQVVGILAEYCIPQFSLHEAEEKVLSAIKRAERRERNISQEVREWVESTEGHFESTQVHREAHLSTKEEMHAVNVALQRLVKEKILEKYGDKRGVYRRIDRSIEYMDFANADIGNTVDLSLPLGLHIKTKLFPKGVIVVAGVSGMGKTLFCFNTIAENMGQFPIFYFNSEMGPEALKHKLSHFPIPISEWEKHMKVIDNWDFNNIPDKIQPDALNVVDYLEPEGERPYNIHGVISSIIRRLNKGTALITIQKKPNATMGTGGIYSIKAATLAIALDWGKIEIVKNRFREADMMPSLNKINFEIHQGYKFVKQGGWYH